MSVDPTLPPPPQNYFLNTDDVKAAIEQQIRTEGGDAKGAQILSINPDSIQVTGQSTIAAGGTGVVEVSAQAKIKYWYEQNGVLLDKTEDITVTTTVKVSSELASNPWLTNVAAVAIFMQMMTIASVDIFGKLVEGLLSSENMKASIEETKEEVKSMMKQAESFEQQGIMQLCMAVAPFILSAGAAKMANRTPTQPGGSVARAPAAGGAGAPPAGNAARLGAQPAEGAAGGAPMAPVAGATGPGFAASFGSYLTPMTQTMTGVSQGIVSLFEAARMRQQAEQTYHQKAAQVRQQASQQAQDAAQKLDPSSVFHMLEDIMKSITQRWNVGPR